MGIDITSTFRNCVQERKKQNRIIPGLSAPENSKLTHRMRCPFIVKCKEVSKRISELRDFLVEHRKSYLNLGPDYLRGSGGSSMTDKERDKVDSGAQTIIKTSSQLLTDLKRDLYAKEDGGQSLETHKSIIDLLEVYLKSVTKIFTEMKAIRVKWTVEVQKMSKFEPSTEQSNNAETKPKLTLEEKIPEGSTFSSNSSAYLYEDESPLSEEELQMLQMENDHLFNELNSLNDEVKSIQSKVIKIAELQEVFTEKVLEQNEDIERISTTLVGTTETLKDANSQIRKAIQSNASFRIYVLFFILVMSFCLLFLDWYNE